jgi:hypothetical protein
MDNTIRLLLGFLGALVIGLMFFIVDMLNTTIVFYNLNGKYSGLYYKSVY